MKRLFLMMLTLMMSVTTWATDPYFEVVSGSFQSGHVTVKATFPDATSVTGISGAWMYLIYDGNKYWNNGGTLYASGSNLIFPGDNTFTATYSFTCPAGATNDLFTLSPYNGDISVDGVSQPGTLVISLSENCDHETVTFHKAVASTTTTYGHEAYNQCNACGKLFRTSDTEHANPLTLADLEYPLLRSNPYFEVLNGSFENKDAEVKVTFPGATNVELSNYFAIYEGSKLITTINNFTISGNEITFSMNPYSYYSNEPGENPLAIRFWFYEDNFSLDGTPTTCYVYSKDAQPYAEVVSGSLADGNATVKVTVPYATEITATTSSPQYYYARLKYKGNNVASLNMTQVSCSGNTITLPYSFTSPGSKTLLYTIDLSSYAFKMDGSSSSAMTVYFQGASYDPEVPGGDDDDDPDDDDPSDEPAAVNYFWVENLSDDATTITCFDKNLEYTNTPDADDSWTEIDYQIDLAAHAKVYLRATAEGNTNMSGSLTIGEVGTTLNGNGEWVPFDTRVPYKVGGDITTLLNAKGNVMALPAPEGEGYWNRGVFEMFFYNDTFLQDASELVLPSTKLAEYCYSQMFYGCSNITTAPVLSATVLVKGCYENMFNGCSNLNYVEAYFSEWPRKSTGYSTYAATENWLEGVASVGTFKTHDWVSNDYRYYGSTYPEGWNREDLTSMNITISAVGYTTFYYDRCWVMPEGMEGYVAYDKYNNGSYEFIFKKVFEAGDIVPWNQPLVMKANAGTYTINFTNEEPTPFVSEDENLEFDGSVLTRDLTDEYNSSNYYWYALSLNAGGDPESVGFYWMADDGAAFTSTPFKAWLRIHKSHFDNSSSVKAFMFNTASDTDAIKSAPASQNESKQLFDLGGRRVNSNNQKSGIYIMNGKKIIR